MSLDTLDAAAGAHGLAVLGAFHPGPDDGAPVGCGTLALIGPGGDAFWRMFRAGPEFGDGGPDPLDRWSLRVIGGLAGAFGAGAVFPFGGPPHRPFTAWARRSGQAWTSPVGLLVHVTRGLMVSYRGALAFPERLDLPPAGVRPCEGCAAPCRTACPAGALVPEGYDVPACLTWIGGPDGGDCVLGGCAVRRACPVGRGEQPAAQSRFHMAAFRGRQRRCDA